VQSRCRTGRGRCAELDSNEATADARVSHELDDVARHARGRGSAPCATVTLTQGETDDRPGSGEADLETAAAIDAALDEAVPPAPDGGCRTKPEVVRSAAVGVRHESNQNDPGLDSWCPVFESSARFSSASRA